jgi:hypothetical protein
VATNYPGSLDSFDTIASDKKTSDSVGGRTHRQMHNDLGDALEAVQARVGLSGASAPEGAVTATPGTSYLQTTSTVDVRGWLLWVKSGGTGNTGWVAGPGADTGWRSLTPASGTSSDLLMRRVGSLVTVLSTTYAASGGGLTYGTPFYVPPTGFRASRTGTGVGRNGTSGAVIVVTGDSSTGLYFLATLGASDPAYFSISYFTDDAWPTSLPGTAA